MKSIKSDLVNKKEAPNLINPQPLIRLKEKKRNICIKVGPLARLRMSKLSLLNDERRSHLS